MKMRKKICAVLGCSCIAAAIALGAYNYWDASRANQASEALTVSLAEVLRDVPAASAAPDAAAVSAPSEEVESVSVAGYDVCGVLSIPDIDVDLAILSAWSYPKLKVSACRYAGAPEGQLMLLAHNYDKHFGRLKELEAGDTVVFTAVDGTVYSYQVTGTEIWDTNQLSEIVAGADWDLTLFTCTYGGKSRVVVRCDKVE